MSTIDGNGESTYTNTDVYSGIEVNEGQSFEDDTLSVGEYITSADGSSTGDGQNSESFEAFTIESRILARTEEDYAESLSQWSFIGFGGAAAMAITSLGIQMILRIFKASSQ